MIDSIEIANTASYGVTPEMIKSLSTFNYFYGANGSGKTTISRVIADSAKFTSCKIQWKNTLLQTMVYNRDFVEKNFGPSTDLKGVFTLGEKNIETEEKISTIKTERTAIQEQIETHSNTLGAPNGESGKKLEVKTAEEEFKTKCWSQKQKYDEKFYSIFEGFRSSAERFKAKILAESKSNTADLLTIEDLEKKTNSIFGENPVAVDLITQIVAENLSAHEKNPVLQKIVIGKHDVDIAAMIAQLGNSDWVKEGLSFYNKNSAHCPFCQNKTTEGFKRSLDEYFDETFLADNEEIEELWKSYQKDSRSLLSSVENIIAAESSFLDLEKLKTEYALLSSKITINTQKISEKRKEPSKAVTFEPVTEPVSAIEEIIADANKLINDHNNTVKNIVQERRTLSSQIWKFLLEVELKADLELYNKKMDSLNKAVLSLEGKIKELKNEQDEKEKEIRQLEKEITSIQPTIDGINGLLLSFGFQGFKLAKSEKESCYRIVRPDEKDAKETLSEGEKTFITFLYFYYFLKGSHSETGVATDRIVVFDDPISSLDSEILFIVSSLIKELLDVARDPASHIKQIFLLTHNIYFHKEVTYNPRRANEALREESFWTIRKLEGGSKLERHNKNPIMTSYELLWAEVRRPDKSKLTIQNTLRRILENYFKILGGINLDTLYKNFDGQERIICKSLVSWVHDGSHFSQDNLFIAIDDATIDNSLAVFKKIFEKSNHTAHYQMMMGLPQDAEFSS